MPIGSVTCIKFFLYLFGYSSSITIFVPKGSIDDPLGLLFFKTLTVEIWLIRRTFEKAVVYILYCEIYITACVMWKMICKVTYHDLPVSTIPSRHFLLYIFSLLLCTVGVPVARILNNIEVILAHLTSSLFYLIILNLLLTLSFLCLLNSSNFSFCFIFFSFKFHLLALQLYPFTFHLLSFLLCSSLSFCLFLLLSS